MRWLLFVLFLAILPAEGGGHETYPPQCCGKLDCAPVDFVQPNSYPLVVTTRFGTKAVDPNTLFFDSQDSRMHACIAYNRLLCLLLPPGQ